MKTALAAALAVAQMSSACSEDRSVRNTGWLRDGLLEGALVHRAEPQFEVGATSDRLTLLPLGADVQSIVFNPVNRLVYTSNRNDGTVSVIDPGARQVVAVVPAVRDPIALLVNPLSGNVYVGGNGFAQFDPPRPAYFNSIDPLTHQVSRVELRDPNILVTFARSYSFAHDPGQNRIWFANAIGPSGDVSVIDGNDDSYVRRLVIRYPGLESWGSIPVGILFNEPLNRAYVISYSIGDRRTHLTMLDGTSLDPLSTVVLNEREDTALPSTLLFNSRDGKIYSGLCDGGVVIVDAATNTVIQHLPIPGCHFALAWNPARDVVYAADYVSGDISVIDGRTDQVVNTIQALPGPIGLAYSQLLDRVLTLAHVTSELWEIDGTSDQVLNRFQAGPFAPILSNNEGAVISPDEETGIVCFANIGLGMGVLSP